MTKPTHILWIDLETTGSGDYSDIIEVGAVITTNEHGFPELQRYESVVIPPDLAVVAEMEPIVVDIHMKNGLLANVLKREGKAIHQVELDLWNMVTDQVGDSDQIAIGGSGVCHFDLKFIKFIKRDMPRLYKRFPYWSYDTGVLRRLAELAGAWAPVADYEKTHRALQDVLDDLDTTRQIMNLFQEGL